MRWLGASTTLTGITGVLDTATGSAGVASGRFGSGDLSLETSGAGSLWTGLRWVSFGVNGYADRIRGVPLMAYSSWPLWLLGRGRGGRR